MGHRRYTSLKQKTKATAKRQTKNQKETEEMDQLVRGVEREVFRPKTKITHGETEAPTYEVEFLRDYRNIEEAWNAGVKKIIKMTEST